MFDWLMRLASSSATFLFPVFASYKALKTNDPQQVTPWLMYWVVIALILVVEAWTEWLLRWLPFYYNVRAAFMLWLVLPQTQGATKLYMEFVHPFFVEHEKEIENLIATAHDQLKAAGYSYLKRAIAHAEEIILGTRRTAERPSTPTGQPYTNFLLNRFKLAPIATTNTTQTATDFYNSISSTLTTALNGAPQKPVSPDQDKAAYFALQQQKLRLAMMALEQEMNAMKTPGGGQGFFKSPSGTSLSDFDHVDAKEVEGAGFWAGQQPQRTTAVA